MLKLVQALVEPLLQELLTQLLLCLLHSLLLLLLLLRLQSLMHRCGPVILWVAVRKVALCR